MRARGVVGPGSGRHGRRGGHLSEHGRHRRRKVGGRRAGRIRRRSGLVASGDAAAVARAVAVGVGVPVDGDPHAEEDAEPWVHEINDLLVELGGGLDESSGSGPKAALPHACVFVALAPVAPRARRARPRRTIICRRLRQLGQVPHGQYCVLRSNTCRLGIRCLRHPPAPNESRHTQCRKHIRFRVGRSRSVECCRVMLKRLLCAGFGISTGEPYCRSKHGKLDIDALDVPLVFEFDEHLRALHALHGIDD